MKVAYLFTGYRGEALERVRRGEDHGSGFWGMTHLARYGITAEIVEIEKFFPFPVARFLRQHILSMHTVHLPVFWKLFSYDIVFSSTGFTSQFLMTVLRTLRVPCPLWVMHDFSITGLIGTRTTLRQKIFAWMVSRVSGIVTISKKEAEVLRQMFPHLAGKIAYVPFGTDLNFFRPLDITKEYMIIVAGTDPDRDYTTLFTACEDLDTEIIVTTYAGRLSHLKTLPPYVHMERFPLEKLPDCKLLGHFPSPPIP